MKKLALIGIIVISIIGCEKRKDNIENQYIAKIVGFDLNCSNCILSFPNDLMTVKNLLGESQNNYYQTVNLDKDEFKIGQLIKVKLRKAEDNELKACITLYPSYNYENMYVLDYEYYKDFTFNDTIDLAYGDCLNDFEIQNSICFDSVLTDSRCPVNVVCIWAGEAVARFRFNIYNQDPILIDLHTGTIDTIINGYKFSFIDLFPYPNTENQTNLEDYKAKIIIRQN